MSFRGEWVASGLTPEADWGTPEKVVYCSFSAGSDANDGLSQGAPVKTLSHGYGLLRDGHNDWLLLKAGDTWPNDLPYLNKFGAGGGGGGYMRIGRYGTGSWPILTTDASRDGSFCANDNTFTAKGHLAVTGIRLVSTQTGEESTTHTGIGWNGCLTDVRLENCRVDGFTSCYTWEGATASDPSTGQVTGCSQRFCHAYNPFRAPDNLALADTQCFYTAGTVGFTLEGFSHFAPETGDHDSADNRQHRIYIQAHDPEDPGAPNCGGFIVRNGHYGSGGIACENRAGGTNEMLCGWLNTQHFVAAANVDPAVLRDSLVIGFKDFANGDPGGQGHQGGNCKSGNTVTFSNNLYLGLGLGTGSDNIAAISSAETCTLTLTGENVDRWQNASGAGDAVRLTGTTTLAGMSGCTLRQTGASAYLVNELDAPAAASYGPNTYDSANLTEFQRSNHVPIGFTAWKAGTGDATAAEGTASFAALADRRPSDFCRATGLDPGATELTAIAAIVARIAQIGASGEITAEDTAFLPETVNRYFYAGRGLRPVARGSGNLYTVGDTASYGGTLYTCLQTHRANPPVDEPGYGSGWRSYWRTNIGQVEGIGGTVGFSDFSGLTGGGSGPALIDAGVVAQLVGTAVEDAAGGSMAVVPQRRPDPEPSADGQQETAWARVEGLALKRGQRQRGGAAEPDYADLEVRVAVFAGEAFKNAYAVHTARQLVIAALHERTLLDPATTHQVDLRVAEESAVEYDEQRGIEACTVTFVGTALRASGSTIADFLR